MFKLFHHCILVEENEDIRTIIAKAQTIEEFTKAVDLLRSRYAQEECQELDVCTFPLPFYLCQPYFRPPPAVERQQQAKRSASDENEAENGRLFADAANLLEGEAISKKKAKKIKRRANKDDEGKKKEPFNHPLCAQCPNPRGHKCNLLMCRSCCKIACFERTLDCVNHKCMFLKKKLQQLEEQSKQELDIT